MTPIPFFFACFRQQSRPYCIGVVPSGPRRTISERKPYVLGSILLKSLVISKEMRSYSRSLAINETTIVVGFRVHLSGGIL